MKIDFHNHILPAKYLNILEKRQTWPKVEADSSGQLLLANGPGSRFPVVKSMYDAEERIREMRECGVDMQVLSLVSPGPERFDQNSGLTIARLVNDELAKLTEKYPEKFVGLASLPLRDVEQSLDELERAVKQLGLKGATIYSNVKGRMLDEREFWPLYERAVHLDIPLFIHPTMPKAIDSVKEYGLYDTIGFIFDTTTAMMRLILSGVLEKYRRLKIVLPHLGSTIPYLIGRIDADYRRKPESQVNISKPPSEYFRLVHIDTVSLHAPSLMCAHSFMGPKKMLLGSDYPFWGLSEAVSSVEDLDIPKEEKAQICSSNAKALLKLS